MGRGTSEFEVTDDGNLVNSALNVEALRRLWLDRTMIHGENLGPGDPGDFDNGAWHVACHLAGAGGVMRAADGRLLWVEISHDAARDAYYASVTASSGADALTIHLDSAEGRTLCAGARLMGFVEGNSTGRISARAVSDPPALFNLWRRQDFDQPVGSNEDGGKVWEHWCTLRDIRPTSRMGTNVLTAYISLAAALGDQFAPTVARGRRDYGHPRQLVAMIKAGFVARKSALLDITPVAIPAAVERLFLESDPNTALHAIGSLDWSNPPRYFMFSRRIKSWSPLGDVQSDVANLR